MNNHICFMTDLDGLLQICRDYNLHPCRIVRRWSGHRRDYVAVPPAGLRQAWQRLHQATDIDEAGRLAGTWRVNYLVRDPGQVPTGFDDLIGYIRPIWFCRRGRLTWYLSIVLMPDPLAPPSLPAFTFAPPPGIRKACTTYSRALPPDPIAHRRLVAAILIQALRDAFVPVADMTTRADQLDALTYLADPHIQDMALDWFDIDLRGLMETVPLEEAA